MTTRHPELAAEQKVVDHCHDCHETTIEKARDLVAGRNNSGATPQAQRVLRDKAVEKLKQLTDVDTSRLVVGRLDFKDEKKGTLYVGPCTVMDGGKVAVVDFTRPVVRGFYHATENDPHGLLRRRSFDVLERELRDISDEVFGTLPPRLRLDSDKPAGSQRTVLDRVASELERAREPHMRDIVASIVSDQYRMIEAPLRGIFVIQGGPGTGKTAVALHRAVYLLRNNEDLGKVLVVGPNAAFMAFISEVLPGLGESRVDQVAIGRLAESGEAQPTGDEAGAVAPLKGDARMATVVQRGVRQRIRETEEPMSFRYEGTTAHLTPDEINEMVRREFDADRPYMEGRRRFIEAMRIAIEGAIQARLSRSMSRRGIDREDFRRRLNNDRDWSNFLERTWPTASAVQVVHDLLTVEQRLRAASAGLLTDAEIEQLLRRGVRSVGAHPWTSNDMPLIDEAHNLVQGIGAPYGYVVVDEAQDLTPMELRMVSRRSRSGDLTLVGDMAQTTGAFRYASWDEVVEHLPSEGGVRRDELRIGYRVPRSIMELANLLLPRIAPDLQPTEPVRESRVDPDFEYVDDEDLADQVALTVDEMTGDERSVGVIVPGDLLVGIRGALAGAGISVGDISTDQLEKRTTLLSSADAKGLEFDRVVVVEPWDIATGSPAGWSELYVALSRATQQLSIVHAKPLPAPLPGGVEPIVEPEPEPEVAPAADDADATRATVDLDLDLDLDTEPATQPVAAPAAASLPAPDFVEPAQSKVGKPEEKEADERKPRAPGAEPQGPRPARVRSAAPRLTGEFSDALVVANLVHEGSNRRGTAIPYVGHLLGVAALVLEDGGNETEAIAAVLHDAVEDGPAGMAETIRRRFGDAVADIVIACTDPVVPNSFRASKEEHFKQLERGSTSVRRVALAEKLDNARALRRDLERYGHETWGRLEVEQEESLWYLRSLVALFRLTFPSVLAEEFARVVDHIEELAEL